MSSIDINSSNISIGSHILETYSTDRMNNTSNIIRRNITKPNVFNVKDYNARGDGTTDDTQAVRNAIEAARQYLQNNNASTAVIYFPSGTYLTRQLVIHSNMYFIGEDMNKTMLKRIVEPSDLSTTFNYPNVPSTISGGDNGYIKAYIKNYNFATGNTNLGLINITVDGNGYSFLRDGDQNHNNFTIMFKRSSNIRADRLRVIDSMNFHVYFKECNNVEIRMIEINGNYYNRLGAYYGGTNYRNNQDGLHFQDTININVDYVKAINTQDDSLIIRSVNRNVYNAYVKYAEVLNQGTGRGLLIQSGVDADVYNVTIDKVIVYGYPRTGISIQHTQEGTTDGNGIPYNIYIKEAIVYGTTTTNVRDPRALLISSRPQALYSTSRALRPIQNITIDYLYFDARMQNNPTKLQRGIIIENAVNVTINKFEILNKSNNGEDILLQEINNTTILNPIILRNGIIRRVTIGGTHITIKNSKYIILDNIQIPRIDANNQGNIGLYIQGTSQYITARQCIFAVTNKYQYDDVARQYANTNQLDIK